VTKSIRLIREKKDLLLIKLIKDGKEVTKSTKNLYS